MNFNNFKKLANNLIFDLKDKNGLFIEDDGTKKWYKNGQLHRDDDLPAVEGPHGLQLFYKNGLMHRDNDLPAIVRADGHQEWRQDGVINRDGDKPAIITSNGNKHWFKNNTEHRDGDLPSLEQADGYKEWRQNGVLNREGNKPAVITQSGIEKFYKNGKEFVMKEVTNPDGSLFLQLAQLVEEENSISKLGNKISNLRDRSYGNTSSNRMNNSRRLGMAATSVIL